jgi:hypothetical protein
MLREAPSRPPEVWVSHFFELAHGVCSFPSRLCDRRSDQSAQLGRDDFRLFPRREVTALFGLVPVDELVIAALGFAEARRQRMRAWLGFLP